MKTILTYGTFDLFHPGHLRLLERAKSLGDRLIVGVSSDEFNCQKGKSSFFSFDDRSAIVAALRAVDAVIKEDTWEQKVVDIEKHNVSTFVMGDDWAGKFDYLADIVEVVYLPRTPGISSTSIKSGLPRVDKNQLEQFEAALDALSTFVSSLKT